MRVYDNTINSSYFIHIGIFRRRAHKFLLVLLWKSSLFCVAFHISENSIPDFFIAFHILCVFITEWKSHTEMALINNGTSAAGHCSEHLRKKIDEWLKWDRVSTNFPFHPNTSSSTQTHWKKSLRALQHFSVLFPFSVFLIYILTNECNNFYFLRRMKKHETKLNSWTGNKITRNWVNCC